jgi:lipoprotein signal peptidase
MKKDKVLHLIVGLLIYGICLFLFKNNPTWRMANLSFAVVVFAGMGKEIRDYFSKNGTVDTNDVWATILIPMIITIVLNFI